ncbi:MAG TPA: CHRD domain-containing protein [Candidatus Nitrosopolaris sp.]|nr:CHRD domain-containing protein [Candidatus Nitrosopolaris sp.]
MSNFHSKISTGTLIASVIAALSTIPILAHAQQQMYFTADLSGKNIVPPVDTSATGTAKFILNPNGTLSYEVDVMNINQVIGAPINLKNGTVLAELLNLYATTGGGNKQQSAYPTGPVSGKLVSDVITAAKLDGPLFGKNVTDLINYMKSGSAYVTIRTTPHQQGEIRGQILPSAAPTTAAPGINKTVGTSAPTTAAPGMNKTVGTSAPTTAAPGMNKTVGTSASSVQRDCIGSLLDASKSNFTLPVAHQQLIDKIAACFNQK